VYQNYPPISIEGNTQVKVLSRLADLYGSSGRLYLAIRGLDADGSGWIEFDVKELAYALGTSVSTIYRGLQDDRFFPVVKRGRKNGRKIVSYRALTKVSALLDLEVGAIAMLPLKVLGDRMHCIALTTAMEVQMGQFQAYYNATKGKTQNEIDHRVKDAQWAATVLAEKEKFKIKPKKRQRKSETWAGLNSRRVGFRYFRIRSHEVVATVSQKTIASRMGRSERTIQRRLSNKNRIRWGTHSLTRRRVIQEFDNDRIAAAVQYHLQADTGSNFGTIRIGDRKAIVGVIKIGKEKPKAYRLLPNVYAANFELIGGETLRRRIFKYKKNNLGVVPPP